MSGYPTPFEQDKHHGSTTYSISSKVEQIQTEIQKNGPVESSFSVYADFPTYRTGVYKKTSDDFLGGHGSSPSSFSSPTDLVLFYFSNQNPRLGC